MTRRSSMVLVLVACLLGLSSLPSAVAVDAGNALDFDGVDDFAHVINDFALRPGTGSWTVEAWVRADALPSLAPIVGCADGDLENGWRLTAKYTDTIGYDAALEDEASGSVSVTSTVATEIGVWRHVAITYRADTDTLRIYRDGGLVLTSFGALAAVTPVADMLFGRYDSDCCGAQYFEGVLDEVRIWNTWRDGTALQATMSSCLVGDEPSLVGYWRFDETGGQTLLDDSPSSNHGTLGTNTTVAADDPTRLASTAPLTCPVNDADGDGVDDSVDNCPGLANADQRDGEGFGDPTAGQRILGSNADDARAVTTADLDDDGDADVLAVSAGDSTLAWYENLGGGSFGAEQIIDSGASGAVAVFAADLDRDVDRDVLVALSGGNSVIWYENLGGGSFAAAQAIPAAGSAAAAVFATDLDGDRDPDVLSAWSDRIVWNENLGGGSFGAEQAISAMGVGASAVQAADLDGDGDPDVLSSEIGWYENLGGSFGELQSIDAAAGDVSALHIADLDGDGDHDVLVAWLSADRIGWYENLGAGSFGAEQNVGAGVDGASGVFAADIDADGDLDPLSAASVSGRIAWHENLGGGGFSEHAININTAGAAAIYADDLNDDGFADVLAAAATSNRIVWHRNFADGVGDACDNCPVTFNSGQGDDDGDGAGNSCDPCPDDPDDDIDGDGVCGDVDNCPINANASQSDADFDGVGDICDVCPFDPNDDADGDGLCADVDNCPTVVNPGQSDGDMDGLGDACDACPLDPDNDADGDGSCGDVDPCPLDPDDDIDGDGHCADADNCPNAFNLNQWDTDGDGLGNGCDNCLFDVNPGQQDLDSDGRGDACDLCPVTYDPFQDDLDEDGVGDACDNCYFTPNFDQADVDGDFEGDACDLDDGMIRSFFDDTDVVAWEEELVYQGWNLYRGDLDTLRSTGVYSQLPGANALAAQYCDLTDTFLIDTDPIPADGVAFYLVTGLDGGEESEFSPDSSGAARPNDSPCAAP